VGQQIGLGSLAGLVVSSFCWRGNQSAGTVSTFPDLLTFVALALLLAVAIRFVLRRGRLHSRFASVRAGVTVAVAAGVVFGAAVVALEVVRFANPAPLLLAFGFFSAVGSALACGLVAALVSAGSPRRRAA
jgi:hypothetical protein